MKKVILFLLMFLLLSMISLPVFGEVLSTDQQNINQIKSLTEEIDLLKEKDVQTSELMNYYKSITDHAINSVLLVVTAASILLTILTLIGTIAIPLISTNKIQKIEKEASIAKEASEDAKNTAIRDLENRILEIATSADEAKDFSKIARSETIASEGLVWYLSKEYDRALKSYNEAIELNCQEPRFYFNKGNVYYEQGYFVKAIEEYNQSINLNQKNNDKAYYNRGRAYCELEQYEKAIEDYTLSIQYNPVNEKAYFNRARTYEKIDKQDLAKNDFDKYQSLINEKKIDVQNNPLLCQW